MLLKRGNKYDQQDEMQNGFTEIKSCYDDQVAFLAQKTFFQAQVNTTNQP